MCAILLSEFPTIHIQQGFAQNYWLIPDSDSDHHSVSSKDFHHTAMLKSSPVTHHAYIGAWMEFSASLPDNDVSSRAGLATIELDAEHLGQGATSVLC